MNEGSSGSRNCYKSEPGMQRLPSISKMLAQLFVLVSVAFALPASVQRPLAPCLKSYTVKEGDFLFKIGQANNLSVQQLLSLNSEIKNPNLIFPDQNICLKRSTKVTCSKTYTVKQGDTLFKIAGRNGITLTQIEQLNPTIPNFDLINIGQKVCVKGTFS